MEEGAYKMDIAAYQLNPFTFIKKVNYTEPHNIEVDAYDSDPFMSLNDVGVVFKSLTFYKSLKLEDGSTLYKDELVKAESISRKAKLASLEEQNSKKDAKIKELEEEEIRRETIIKKFE
jgi:hypothetical protein